MMTTTALIELLKKYENGASGRSREISFNLILNSKKPKFVTDIEVSFCGSGDGVAGAELTLNIKGCMPNNGMTLTSTGEGNRYVAKKPKD